MRSTLDLLFSDSSTCSSSGSGLCTTSEFLLFGNHGLDTIIHVLDEINLRASESSLVGDIVDVVGRFRVLSMNSSDLNEELISNGLEISHFSTKLRQGDVD